MLVVDAVARVVVVGKRVVTWMTSVVITSGRLGSATVVGSAAGRKSVVIWMTLVSMSLGSMETGLPAADAARSATVKSWDSMLCLRSLDREVDKTECRERLLN